MLCRFGVLTLGFCVFLFAIFLIQERKGFGGDMNWSDFSGDSLTSFWDEIAQTDEKVCRLY